MSMHKRDYDVIADALKYSGQQATYVNSDYGKPIVKLTAEFVAEALEANNDNFDRAVFLAKAGVKI